MKNKKITLEKIYKVADTIYDHKLVIWLRSKNGDKCVANTFSSDRVAVEETETVTMRGGSSFRRWGSSGLSGLDLLLHRPTTSETGKAACLSPVGEKNQPRSPVQTLTNEALWEIGARGGELGTNGKHGDEDERVARRRSRSDLGGIMGGNK
jgi:hypothetical protein